MAEKSSKTHTDDHATNCGHDVESAPQISSQDAGAASSSAPQPQPSPSASIPPPRSQTDSKIRHDTDRASMPGAFAVPGVAAAASVLSSSDNQTTIPSSQEMDETTNSVVTENNQADNRRSQSPSSDHRRIDEESPPLLPDAANIDNIHDGENEEAPVPMLQAELVTPPVEALHVEIDESTEMFLLPNTRTTDRGSLEVEQAPTSEVRMSWPCHKYFRNPRTVRISILLLLVILVSVLVATLIRHDDKNKGDTTVNDSGQQEVTYPYPCYTSTFDILQSQRFDEEIPDAYVLCPNTTIQVGTFNNPAVNDFSVVNGDFPIIVIRPNITIQCGLDGKRENNCVLTGGFMQVLELQQIPTPDGGFTFDDPIDNMVVRGITFTGQPENAGPFNGISVDISHPGMNIRFEDCAWTDMFAQNGLITITRNYYQKLLDLPLEDNSIQVLFSDCLFQNIVYDAPLIEVDKQAVILERCIFRNIELSVLIRQKCSTDYSGAIVGFAEGCAGLLYCGLESSCIMNNVCVENLEWYGAGMVVLGDTSQFDYNDGLYLNGSSSPSSESSLDCQAAEVQTIDSSFRFECNDIFTAPSCPI